MSFLRGPVSAPVALAAATSLLVLASLLPARPAAGQAEAAAPSETAAEQPAKPVKKVVTIPIAEIASRSEQAKALFAEIEQKLAPSEAASGVERQLPEVIERIQQRKLETERALAEESNPARLEELLGSWKGLQDEILALQQSLRGRSEEIEQEIERIRTEREVWGTTRAQSEEDTPDAVLQTISEVEVAADRVKELAKARQGAIVTLQSRVAQLTRTGMAAQDDLKQARLARVASVSERDRLPIWAPGAFDVLGTSLRQRLGELQEQDLAVIRVWTSREKASLIVHAIFFIGLAILLRGARNRVRARAESDAALEGMEGVFRHPIALALLLTLLTGLWTLGAMPRPVSVIVSGSLAPPALLVLRHLLARDLFPILNVLMLLWIVDLIRVLISPLQNAPRVLLMLEMALVLGLMLWWMRPARLAQIPSHVAAVRSFRVAAVGVRIALASSLVALVAEASGFGALAELVAETLLLAAFAGMVLYGAVRALDGIAAVLLRVRPLNLLGMVQRHRALVRRRIRRAVGAGALLWWSYEVLDRLGLTQPLFDTVLAILSAPLPIGELVFTLGDALLFLLTIWLTFKLSSLVRFALEEDVFPRAPLKKGQPYAVSTLLHYVILTIGFIVAILALGFDMTRVTLLAGAFGVGIGFGLQTIVSNFVSGLILLTERPIEVGDTVSLGNGEVFGEVKRIGIRSSTVRTWQGAEVIVPNAELIAQSVINWTHSDRRRRLEIPVGVAYGTDPRRVIEILEEVGRADTRTLDDPAPYVLFLGFGESSLDFELRAWTDHFDDYLMVRSGLCVAINAALEAAGVTIPFPQRDLHLKSVAEAAAAQDAPAEAEAGPPPVGVVRG